MSGAWTAMNVLPDDEDSDEVDDTPELRIEEALRLYQNAIKLHAQGPSAYGETAKAYDALFESEAFQYDEQEPGPVLSEQDDYTTDDEESDGRQLVGRGRLSDRSPSSLAQLLHLAYKNRGQFKMDRLRYRLETGAAENSGSEAPSQIIDTASNAALEDFAEALKRDEGDLELWRRAGKLAERTGRARVARLCLESALSRLNGATVRENNLHQLTLEEGLAREQLNNYVGRLGDSVSLAQNAFPRLKPRRLTEALYQELEPYSFLPPQDRSDAAKFSLLGHPPVRHDIELSDASWSALGEALLARLVVAPDGAFDIPMGAGIRIALPSLEAQATRALEELPAETSPDSGLDSTVERTAGKDSEISNQGVETGAANSAPSTPARSRKRALSVAGSHDRGDGARARSKRIRARGSIVALPLSEDRSNATDAEPSDERLQECCKADEALFEALGKCLDTIGVDTLGMPGTIQDDALGGRSAHPLLAASNAIAHATVDLCKELVYWAQPTADIVFDLDQTPVADPQDNPTLAPASNMTNVDNFLKAISIKPRTVEREAEGPTLQGIREFALNACNQWLDVAEVATLWLEVFFSSKADPETSSTISAREESSYIQDAWTSSFKQIAVQLMRAMDSLLYQRYRLTYETTREHIYNATSFPPNSRLSSTVIKAMEMVQTIYELHVEIHATEKNQGQPRSSEDHNDYEDIPHKWAMLMDDFVEIYSYAGIRSEKGAHLKLRYAWASARLSILSDGVVHDQVVSCIQDLKTLLQALGNPVFRFPNNGAMPEISVAAVDGELLRATASGLFLHILRPEADNPALLIELESILVPRFDLMDSAARSSSTSSHELSESAQSDVDLDRHEAAVQGSFDRQASQTQTATKFLSKRPASSTLLLWRILQDAHRAQNNLSKVLYCNLRCIELVMSQFNKVTFLKNFGSGRQLALLKWLRIADVYVEDALRSATNDLSPYEMFANDDLRAAACAIGTHIRLLYTEACNGDMLKPAQWGNPSPLDGMFHDMQIRAWTLLYTVTKESTRDGRLTFPASEEDLARCLMSIHQSAHLRSFCGASNNVFLKYELTQMLQLTAVEGTEREILLILHGLYRLNLSPGGASLHNDGGQPEALDRRTAVLILPFVVSLLNRLNVKELSKPEYRAAIDDIQRALGSLRNTNSQVLMNSRVLQRLLKSTINPRDLWRAARGYPLLTSSTTPPQEISQVASSGWYYLLGYAALMRFRSQKRTSPGPIDDLLQAQQFFRADLTFNMDKWETWWRLAQIFDSMIEEDVVWSANKLNNFRDGLNVLQRNAIHCYSLAVSISMQQTDPPSAEIAGKLFELFHDFGLRIYASSRPPFAMEVFSVNEFSRPFSGEDMYSGKPHLAVTEEIAWKFSAFLFGRALNYKKSHWHSHYMKAKCLWKMCCRGVANDEGPVYVQDVVESLQLAVRAVPKRRSDRQDPIIEPFYKLMSVVNKAVRGGKLSVTEGHRILEDNTPFTRGISPPGLPSQWDEFMELVLKALSAADKAGWHHRMAARLAHIKFETSAYAARHLLTPRILTKSMNLQIWKPDNERPGRHCVYVSRYASFCGLLFVCLLDLRGMESLAKRVRKKVSECYEHTKLWTEIFEGYIKILEGEARKEGVVLEDAVFKSITHEDFEAGADKLKEWSEGPTASHKLLDVLSSAMELKKLNASLAKAARLDSLLEHTFATLYGAVVPTLTAPEARTTPAIAATAGMDAVSAKKAADRRHKMSVDNLLLDVVPEDVGVESGRTEDGDPSEVVGPPGHSAAATRVAAGSRPRAKAITRREILRKAEMVVSSKAVAVAAVAAASRASGRSQGAVRAGGPALVHFSAPEDGDGDEDRDGDGDGDGDGDRDGRAQPRTWTRSPEKQPAGERRRRSNSQSDDAASGHATPPVAEDWQGSGAENGHGFLDAHDDQRRGAGAMDVDDDDDLPLDSFPQDHHLAAEEEDDIDQDEHELDEVLTEGMSIDGEDDDALDDEEEEEEEEDGGVRDVVPPAGVVMLTTPPFPQLPSMRTAPPVVRLPSMRTTSPPALRPNVPMTSPAALLPIPRLITISPLARLPRMRTTPPAVRREAEGDDVIMLDAHEE